ncbi:transmembrane protein 87A-like [Liasis olivaceus]
MAAGRRLVCGAGTRLPLRLLPLLLAGAALGPRPAGGAASEPGRWGRTADGNQTEKLFVFSKTMFKGTFIILKFPHENCNGWEGLLNVTWYLRSSRCHHEIYINEREASAYLTEPEFEASVLGDGQYIWNSTLVQCGQFHKMSILQLPVPKRLKHLPDQKAPASVRKREAPKAAEAKGDKKEKGKEDGTGHPNEEAAKPSETQDAKPLPSVNGKAAEDPKKKGDVANRKLEPITIAETWNDGPYVFILSVKSPSPKWKLSIDIQMKHPEYKYISASEWPLKVFYMVMCIVYVLYGVLWLSLLACYWRDILRIQFWIGGVILLGMLEKAVFYAEFQSIQSEGESVQGAVIFGEVLCAVKRMLARVLVIIASLGYGIVKPRLGALLNRVVGVGMMYLIFSIIEGVLRVKSAQDDLVLLAAIPLALLDSALCWWISSAPGPPGGAPGLLFLAPFPPSSPNSLLTSERAAPAGRGGTGSAHLVLGWESGRGFAGLSGCLDGARRGGEAVRGPGRQLCLGIWRPRRKGCGERGAGGRARREMGVLGCRFKPSVQDHTHACVFQAVAWGCGGCRPPLEGTRFGEGCTGGFGGHGIESSQCRRSVPTNPGLSLNHQSTKRSFQGFPSPGGGCLSISPHFPPHRNAVLLDRGHILISLVQTMKLLKLRRNLVKLSLYRHFTNTLIFAVIASLIFIVWTTKTFRLATCQSDWRELWIDDAFWRFLFSIILLVIMFLWRPSANNQRYAFMPLVDEGSEQEDEDEEQVVNEVFGMKMRGGKPEVNGILKGNRVLQDEDLKWVEENIPSSMADVMLPPLLDSDEEIVTTKFEMSKME